MIKAYCISDNNVDVYRQLGMVYPGGNGLNTAVNFVRTGNQAAYCGYVGNDRLGDLQKEALKAEGVDTSCIRTVDMQQDWAWIMLLNGDRRFCGSNLSIRKSHHITLEDVKRGQTGEYDLICTGLETTFEPDAWAQLGKSDVPVVCDFANNWDSLWGPGRNGLEESKGIVDYFCLSMENRPEKPEDLLKKCVEEYGAKLALGTLGARGSVVYNGKKYFYQTAFELEPIDTMACGDTYISTFASAYLGGLKLLNECAGIIGIGRENRYYAETEDALISHSMCLASLNAARNCLSRGGFGHGIPYDDSMISRSTNLEAQYERLNKFKRENNL